MFYNNKIFRNLEFRNKTIDLRIKTFLLYTVRENFFDISSSESLVSPLLFSRFESRRDRSRNRANENSSASARERDDDLERVESIWTTFSLAR